MKVLKIVLVFSLLLNLVGACFVLKRIYWKYKSATDGHIARSTPKVKYYSNREDLFESFPKDSNSIVFLGNSLTQGFELAEFLKNAHVKNRGISGDNINSVMSRLGPIIESQPKKIFIEIGLNDIDNGVSKDNLVSNYEKLVNTLLAGCKTTKIYVQSLTPVGNSSVGHPVLCNPKSNLEIREINKELEMFCKQTGIGYVDVYSSLVLNEALNPEYSVDGVHLTGAGYLKWTEVLKPFVDKD